MKYISSAPTDLTYCLEVSQLATSPPHLPIGWTLPRWVLGSTIFAFGFCLYDSLWFCFSGDYCLLVGSIIDSCDFTASQSLFHSRLFYMKLWSHYASTLLTHANTWSLVTEFVSLSDVNSHIISTIMPLINHSLKHLSNSLYLYFAVLISCLPINSSAFELPHLLSMQYCNWKTVSLFFDLNLLFKVSNRLSTILLAPHSAWARASRIVGLVYQASYW